MTPMVTPTHLQANAQQEAFYLNRLKTAPPQIKARLDALQAEGKQRGWTFTVGYTTAMDRSLAQLTG
ncbi:MAG: hypothetical protein KJS68_16060, partial [Alphaproteobacteria bacterium]|nr:hypothetical protein [Alphaproteobacteria bacterium]